MLPGVRLHGQEASATTSDSTPSPKPHHPRKKKSTPEKSEEVPPTQLASHQKVDPENDTASTATKKKKAVVDGESNAATPKSENTVHAPAATIEAGQIADFSVQPEPVQQLLKAALALTKLNLTYAYGSDDPSRGGMDCSGTIYYLLRSQGLKDVPRDSSEQYIWARQHGQFFAVVSTEADGFEFKDLQPGDLMFWSGTYKTERTVPITHVMMYLGREKASGKRIMFGSSDGRSYHGIQRWGVSVFDFTMPKANPAIPEKHVSFVGYARIPTLRELPTVAAKAKGEGEALESFALA
jgi:cell wall-associated NlpC family hydrolase